MGGDHKCPVCQATFTRPQHVARHMRSHTGDRPYKCQYCGDQFARSDLLSRHINKCHANEKPLPNSGSRRKGSASASRATTSKQACDQCVQSSLPCDGANPCSKCVQRKCRCTFVKFHRQTAPAGPGHNPRPTPASTSRISMYPNSDDFILGPAPSPAVSTMAESLYAAQTFSFPPLYPSAQEISSGSSVSLQDSADYTSKYRTQADLLRSSSGTGLHPSLSSSLPSGLFAADPRASSTGTGPSWMDWGQDQQPQYPVSQQQRHDGMHDQDLVQAGLTNQFIPLSASGNAHGQSQHTTYVSGYNHPARDRRGSVDFSSDGSVASHSKPSSATSSSVHLPLAEVHHQHQTQQQQQDNHSQALPFNSQTHHQQTNSTQSQTNPQGYSSGEGGFSSAFGLMSLDDPDVLAGLAQDGAPFFSGNGGVLDMGGGIGEDPDATPMPQGMNMAGVSVSQGRGQSISSTTSNPSSSLPSMETPNGDMRELHKFWKQYMRTPLSGPGTGALTSATGGTSSTAAGAGSETGYRRSRVASFPSARSPGGNSYPNIRDSSYQHNVGFDDNNPDREGVTSSMRTTLHASQNEDLRSYEAAVLARKAPTHLSLGPKATARRGTVGSMVPGPGISELRKNQGNRSSVEMTRRGAASVGASPVVGNTIPAAIRSSAHQPPGLGGLASETGTGTGNAKGTQSGSTEMPPSSSSSSSSLAGVFGRTVQHIIGSGTTMSDASRGNPNMNTSKNSFPVTSQNPYSNANPHNVNLRWNKGLSSSPSSRESSVDSTSISASASDGGHSSDRPSFKRLPSQTLVPTRAKRAHLTAGANKDRLTIPTPHRAEHREPKDANVRAGANEEVAAVR